MPFNVIEPEQSQDQAPKYKVLEPETPRYKVISPESPVQKLNATIPDIQGQGNAVPLNPFSAGMNALHGGWDFLVGQPVARLFEGMHLGMSPETAVMTGQVPQRQQATPEGSLIDRRKMGNPYGQVVYDKVTGMATPSNVGAALLPVGGIPARAAGVYFGLSGVEGLIQDLLRLISKQSSGPERLDAGIGTGFDLLSFLGGAHGAMHEGRLPAQETPEGATTQRTSLGNAKEVVSQIAGNDNHPYQGLAKEMLKGNEAALENTKFKVGDENAYNPETREITVRPERVNNDFVLLHEIAHRLTNEKLKSSFGGPLKELYEQTKAQLGERGKGLHGLENVDEFTSEALTNPAFQQTLKFLRAGDRSVMDRFIDMAYSAVGRARVKGSVLEKVAPEAQGLMNRQAAGLIQDVARPGLPQMTPELMRQDLEQLRGQERAGQVRPAQGGPRMIGELPPKEEVKQGSPEFPFLGQVFEPDIVPGIGFKGEPKQGGQISFEGQGVPSAMQAKEMVPPQKKLSSGLDTPEEVAKNLRPAVKVGSRTLVGEQGDSHADILKRNGIDPNLIPHEDSRRGFSVDGEFLSRTEAQQRSGLNATAKVGGLDSMDLPGAAKVKVLRESGFNDKEIEEFRQEGKLNSGLDLEKIEDTFTPTARLLLRDTKRLRYEPSKAGDYDAGQLVNRLMNEVPPLEKEVLEGAGIREQFKPGQKVKAEEVDKWVKENGPKVEVRKLNAQDVAVTPEEKRMAVLIHRLDTELPRWRSLASNEVPERFRDIYNEQYQLSQRIPERESNESNESATASHQSVNPKPLNEMPGAVDLLVRVPQKTTIAIPGRSDLTPKGYNYEGGKMVEPPKYSSDHYRTEGKNLLAHVRGYMDTIDGKKVFRVFEVQSDWAQNLRDRREQWQRQVNQGNLQDTPSERATFGVNDDPLLRHHERLALKAAIDHARKNGAEALAVDDGQTAMMTQLHHELRNLVQVDDPGLQSETFDDEYEMHQMADQLREEGFTVSEPDEPDVNGYTLEWVEGGTGRPKQEKGMLLHYDETLPKIAEELTGSKGEMKDFGKHQNAFKDIFNREDNTVGEQRKDLIFRNPDGTPKTTSTARVYSLEKTGDAPYSLMGRKLYSGLDAPTQVKELWDSLKVDYGTISTALSSQGREIKDLIAAKRDAVDNAPMLTQERAESHLNLMAGRLFKGQEDLAKQAANVYLEAKGDPTKLSTFKAQATKAGYSPGVKAVDFAVKNWKGVEKLAADASAIDDFNLKTASAAGIKIPSREFYVKRAYETDESGFFTRGRPSPGTGKSSLLPRKYDTVFDAIEAGFKPQTLDVSALVGKRTREIFQEVNLNVWTEGMKKMEFEGRPVVQDLGKPIRGTRLPPEGYVSVQVAPGKSIAVLHGFDRIFKAVSMESAVANSLPGRIALEGVGAVKHGTLLFDSFHLLRVEQFYKSLGLEGKHQHGLAMLEYSTKDIDEAIKQGKLPASARAYVNEKVDVPQGTFSRREVASLGVSNGLNVGKHSEALYTSFVREFPGLKQTIGAFNRFTFDKLTRGAMMDAFQREFERVAEEQFTWSKERVARSVARDLNFRMGNLGRQGLFKNKNFQDMLQIAFLAPRWVESMGQAEARSVGQVIQSFNPKSDRFGTRPTLLRSTTNLLAVYIAGTQVINFLSTGHGTWDNPKEHQLDAWIPPVGKKGKGFWLSPLSVVAELTHDVVRYSREGLTPTQTVGRMAENKLSNVGRAIDVGLTGGPMDRGQGGIGAGLEELVNPSPLPLRQAMKSIKTKDIVPAERQTFGTLGLKAEPESPVEQRERETKGANLDTRAAYEKESIKARKEKDLSLSLDERLNKGLSSGEKAREMEVVRKKEVNQRMDKPDRQWAESRGLAFPGVDNHIKWKDGKVTLTKEELNRFEELVTKEYSSSMKTLRSNYEKVYDTAKSQYFTSIMLAAKAKARSQLIKEIQSGSKNEQDGEKKKRFSVFSRE